MDPTKAPALLAPTSNDWREWIVYLILLGAPVAAFYLKNWVRPNSALAAPTVKSPADVVVTGAAIADRTAIQTLAESHTKLAQSIDGLAALLRIRIEQETKDEEKEKLEHLMEDKFDKLMRRMNAAEQEFKGR